MAAVSPLLATGIGLGVGAFISVVVWALMGGQATRRSGQKRVEPPRYAHQLVPPTLVSRTVVAAPARTWIDEDAPHPWPERQYHGEDTIHGDELTPPARPLLGLYRATRAAEPTEQWELP